MPTLIIYRIGGTTRLLIFSENKDAKKLLPDKGYSKSPNAFIEMEIRKDITPLQTE